MTQNGKQDERNRFHEGVKLTVSLSEMNEWMNECYYFLSVPNIRTQGKSVTNLRSQAHSTADVWETYWPPGQPALYLTEGVFFFFFKGKLRWDFKGVEDGSLTFKNNGALYLSVASP